MARNNNNRVAQEPLISNAPLKDAELSTKNNAQVPATTKAKAKKKDKAGAGSKARRTFKEMFSELKKVSWPTAKKTLSMFGIVVAVVAIFLIVISAFDYGIMSLIKLLMNHSVVK